MSVLLKSGRISHIGKATMTSGSHQNGSHSWSLRIDNMPATIKSQSHLSFADGDFVTAAGDMKNGTLNIYSYRNETTGAHQNPGSSAGHVLGVFLIIMGILLTIVFIGIPVWLIGITIFKDNTHAKKAKALVENHPRLQPKTI